MENLYQKANFITSNMNKIVFNWSPTQIYHVAFHFEFDNHPILSRKLSFWMVSKKLEKEC